MANNGFVFISNAAKAHAVCQRASKFVRRVLYVKVKDYSENTLPVLSNQIENVYAKVRVLLFQISSSLGIITVLNIIRKSNEMMVLSI